MSNLASRLLVPGVLALFAFGVLFYLVESMKHGLENRLIVSGWALFGLLILLGVLNVRKKLIAFNLGLVRHWVSLHIAGGVLAIAIFLLHTKGVILPLGIYEQIIAVLFWSVCITGIFGTFVITTYPRRLTELGGEIVYDKIPSEMVSIREQAEDLVIECSKASGQSTLSDHYDQTMDWFFRKPRFYFNSLFGGDRSVAWVNRHIDEVRRYLGSNEEQLLNDLHQLALNKSQLDKQYAHQDVMRKWLLLHVPLSIGLIGMSVWHVIMIHVYAQ